VALTVQQHEEADRHEKSEEADRHEKSEEADRHEKSRVLIVRGRCGAGFTPPRHLPRLPGAES
jgi:hypothetical protein